MTTELAERPRTQAPTPAPRPEDADALWRSYRVDQDADLRNELLVRYLPLVKYVAGRLRANLPGSHDAADLVSDGVFGLIDAIEKFDPTRGVQFQTYASQRVRGAIIDALRTQNWVPRTVRDRKRFVEQTTADLQHELGRTPTADEIARAAGLSAEELHQIRRRPTLSVGVSEEDIDALDWGPQHDLTTSIALTDAVNQLAERDQAIIALYFYDGLTLAEIGQVLGVTEGRVSQLRTRALKALRTALEA